MKFNIIFFLLVSLFSYTNKQIEIIKQAYKIGSYTKANNNHTFGDTLVSIILTESSAGKYIIGDNYYNGKEKAFLDKSLGVGQVKLETAIHMILLYPKHYKYFKQYIHRNPFAYKVYSKYLLYIKYYSDILERYKNNNTRRGYRVRRWARRELRYYKNKMKPYKKYYKIDMELAQQLLINNEFNLDVAANYLKTNYNIALRRQYKNPYFKAISRYNGGWKNKVYYKRVIKNMRYWEKLKKKLHL